MEIKDQVVLVTGASRGLGREIARAFAREGARVIGNYFNSGELAENLVQELGDRAVAIRADVRDADQVKELFEQAKQLLRLAGDDNRQ